MPFYDFNHCDYHELPLDYIMKLARESMGLKLKVVGDTLQLVNDAGQALSTVTVSYSEKALTDTLGHDIKTYLISVSDVNNQLVFVKGNGDVVYVTPSFATKAEKDVNNHNIVDYVYNVSIAGDKLRITKGDQAILDLTLPFATKAATDINSKDLTSYAATLAVDGNNVVLRDSLGRLLNSIIVPFATNATNAVNAEEAEHADDADHADEADHASDSDTADYATLSTDATNAVETVTISGNNMIFTTFGGQSYTITCPYSIKSLGDSLGNKISETYVANVTQDSNTNKIQFWDAEGNLIVELLPTVDKAVHDSYNNLIADYVKQIVVSQNSNYVTVTHGTGATDTLVVHYSETAWKDTNNNVIKNTYIKRLACEEDIEDGKYKLVAYNGDTPEAELFRIPLICDMAAHDVNGKALTSYVADVDINANKEVVVKDGEGTTINTFDTIKNAVYAEKDVNDKDITSYVSAIGTTIEAPRIQYTDGTNTIVDSIKMPQVQVDISSSVDPWSMNNTNFTSSNVGINYTDGYLVLQTMSDDAEVVLSYNGKMYFAKAKSQYADANNRTHTIFESELTASGVWQIDLVTTSLGAFYSCTGNVVSAGGGGGGSSTTILGLYDPNTGHLMNLGSVSQNMTVEVWDITDINNPVALDDNDMLTKIQAGQCYFKDSRFNTYSIVYDSSATKIGVIYNAADQPYYMSIGFQWATNWNIDVNKTIHLQ